MKSETSGGLLQVLERYRIVLLPMAVSCGLSAYGHVRYAHLFAGRYLIEWGVAIGMSIGAGVLLAFRGLFVNKKTALFPFFGSAAVLCLLELRIRGSIWPLLNVLDATINAVFVPILIGLAVFFYCGKTRRTEKSSWT
jgi:hypothetical protein